MPSRLFPVAPTGRDIFRRTHVIWDTHGYSIQAGRLCPYSIREQISKALNKDGFHGDVSLCVYCDPKTWLLEDQSKFWRVGFDVCICEGDKLARRSTLVADLVYWSFHLLRPTNLLILSENKDTFNKDELEEDDKLSRLFKALENKGCTIASAHPETLFSPEECSQEICNMCAEETCLAE